MDTEIKTPARPLDEYANNDLPNVEQEHVDQLPADQPNDWHIEMRYLPLAHRGHAFLALVDPKGKVQREMHGLARSRNTGELVALGQMAQTWSRYSRLGRILTAPTIPA